MYRWDQALYTNQLVSADLLDALFTAYVPIPNSDGFGYGYGWAIGERFGRRVANHSGGIEGFSAHIARYPDDGVVVIVLSNQQRTNPQAIATALAQILFEDE
jgi:CubicO group peptidase (beta-lactamase class C family)